MIGGRQPMERCTIAMILCLGLFFFTFLYSIRLLSHLQGNVCLSCILSINFYFKLYDSPDKRFGISSKNSAITNYYSHQELWFPKKNIDHTMVMSEISRYINTTSVPDNTRGLQCFSSKASGNMRVPRLTEISI